MSYLVGRGQLNNLSIFSPEKKIGETDISHIVTSFKLYEDMFSPFVSAEFNVMDGSALMTTIDLSGGEYIKLSFSSGGARRKFDLVLMVDKIINKERLKDDIEAYTICAVSEEYLFNNSISVPESFSKKNISNMVQQVIEKYITPIGGKRLFYVEASEGLQSVLSNNQRPFELIKRFADEAQSPQNPDSVYFFYENAAKDEGYVFATIDDLYSKEPKHTFVKDIITESEGTAGANVKLANVIRDLQINDFPSVSSYQNNGGNVVVHIYDFLTGRYEKKVLGLDGAKERKGVYTPMTNITKKQLFNPREWAAKSNFVAIGSSNYNIPEKGSTEYIKERQSPNEFTRRYPYALAKAEATRMRFGSIRIHFSIPGDSHVKVGDTMNIVIPSADDTTSGKRKNDYQLSGKYIATAIKHVMEIGTGSGSYMTVVEAMRKGLENA